MNTMLTRSMSIPRPNRFVATRIRFWKSLKDWYLDNLQRKQRYYNFSAIKNDTVLAQHKYCSEFRGWLQDIKSSLVTEDKHHHLHVPLLAFMTLLVEQPSHARMRGDINSKSVGPYMTHCKYLPKNNYFS